MTDLRRLAHDFTAGGEQPLFLVAAQSPGVFAALRLVLDGRVFDRVAQSVLSYLDPREHNHGGKTHRRVEWRMGPCGAEFGTPKTLMKRT